jgi:hypothetical protein
MLFIYPRLNKNALIKKKETASFEFGLPIYRRVPITSKRIMKTRCIYKYTSKHMQISSSFDNTSQ